MERSCFGKSCPCGFASRSSPLPSRALHKNPRPNPEARESLESERAKSRASRKSSICCSRRVLSGVGHACKSTSVWILGCVLAPPVERRRSSGQHALKHVHSMRASNISVKVVITCLQVTKLGMSSKS